MRVRKLVWVEPTKLTNGCWCAECELGVFSVAFDDGWHAELNDGRDWEWEPELDPRSYEGPYAAQRACQAYRDARILSAIEDAGAREGAEPLTMPVAHDPRSPASGGTTKTIDDALYNAPTPAGAGVLDALAIIEGIKVFGLAADGSDLRDLASRIEALEAEVAGPAYGIIDPDYARVFTIARCIAWSEGYALLMHGSFTRDLDLLAVPWTERAGDPEHLVRRIEAAIGDVDVLVKSPGAASQATQKPHGRMTWTLTFNAFGDPRFIDLSVMPRATTAEADLAALRAEVERKDKALRGLIDAVEYVDQAAGHRVIDPHAVAEAYAALAPAKAGG